MAGDVGAAQAPYVGPRPFRRAPDDQKIFFGRRREIAEVVSYIYSQPQLFLYAASGCGKTSLLNAGVIPELEQGNIQVLPTARVRGVVGSTDKVSGNPYVANVLSCLVPETDRRTAMPNSLPEFLDGLPPLLSKRGRPSPRVLIIDQFEEILAVYSKDSFEHQEQFFGEISTVLGADPLLRVVLVVREDRIAPLEPFARLLPDGLGTRLRLERLTAQAALEAVVRPTTGSDRWFAPGVAEELVQRLLTTRAEVRPGTFGPVTGRFVEPVQLQVACEALWRRAGPGEITLADLAEFGDVDRALADHYEAALGRALRRSAFPEHVLRWWFDSRLITPMRTRGTVFQAQSHTDGIPNDLVGALEDEHIVRAERRAAGVWYELAHDTLIEPVLAANKAWRERHRKPTSRGVYVAIVLLVIALGIGVWLSAYRNGDGIDVSPGLYGETAASDEGEIGGAVSSEPVVVRAYEGQRLAVAVQAFDGLDADIRIRGPRENLLTSTDLDAGSSVQALVAVPTAGEYTVTVEARDRTSGRYQIQLAAVDGLLRPDDQVAGSTDGSTTKNFALFGSGGSSGIEHRVSSAYSWSISVFSPEELNDRSRIVSAGNGHHESDLDFISMPGRLYVVSLETFGPAGYSIRRVSTATVGLAVGREVSGQTYSYGFRYFTIPSGVSTVTVEIDAGDQRVQDGSNAVLVRFYDTLGVPLIDVLVQQKIILELPRGSHFIGVASNEFVVVPYRISVQRAVGG